MRNENNGVNFNSFHWFSRDIQSGRIWDPMRPKPIPPPYSIFIFINLLCVLFTFDYCYFCFSHLQWNKLNIFFNSHFPFQQCLICHIQDTLPGINCIIQVSIMSTSTWTKMDYGLFTPAAKATTLLSPRSVVSFEK